MNEVPLHPALVHLPIAFVLFAPVFATWIFREISRLQRAANTTADGAQTAREFERRHWRLVALWAFVQAAVVYATMVTGELDADRFESFLAAEERSTPAERAQTLRHIEAHEDAASLLLFASIVVFFLAVIGMKPTPAARWWRCATIAAQLFALAACVYTARLGGELVYIHGAVRAIESQAAHPPEAEHTHGHE